MTKLSERLEELAAFLAHEYAVDSVEETLAHLQTEVEEAMALSRASAQQCTILLFQSTDPPNLLRFLSSSANFADDARKREISAARGGVLDLLAKFLKVYGTHPALSKQHVVDLFKACQQTAHADSYSRVKAQAVTVVTNVLKYTANQVGNDDIDPRAYVEKLFNDIKFSKAMQTAKGQMLELIGHLVEKFPRDTSGNVPPLLSWIEIELEKQFSSNGPEMMLISGLLFALARLLECNKERYKQDEARKKKIYSYLLTVFATTVSGNLSRFQVTNSAETFLAKHAQIFQQEIGENGELWFSYVQYCCESENKTIKEHAFACSNAVLQVVNTYLSEVHDDSRKKCLNKILKEVLPDVSNSTAGTSTMSFAVQCIGWLASSIYLYLGAKGYTRIENKLKLYGESLLALDTKAVAWRWPLFSQYLQCIGQFVQQRHDVVLGESFVKFFGDMMCHLMTAYPQCHWKSKVVVHKPIAAVLVSLSKWTVLDPLINRFVLHTLMLSISSVTESDEVVIYHPNTGEFVTNLLFEYEGFWLAILRLRTEGLVDATPMPVETSNIDVPMGDHKNTRRTLQAIFFDSTVKHVLDIISQLDLSYQFDLHATNNGKDTIRYTPTVPRDHSIMLNLTAFVERVLGKMPNSLLQPWIPLIVEQIISLAAKAPLVSCFYRIGTVVAAAMNGLVYFESPATLTTTRQFRDKFTSFIEQVTAQAQFYQDELLLRCSEFILTAPGELVTIRSMVGVVKPLLELGRSFLPAAIVAVTTLERWQIQRPNELEDSISDLLPLLLEYLDQEGLSDKELWLMKPRGTDTVNTDEISNFTQLQRRLLLLLGNCGGNISLLMSEPPSVINSNSMIKMNSSPYFRLELQLGEVSASLAMNEILSHLGTLACKSSNRRLKVSACEGYHALVCFLCGKTTTHPHPAGKKTEFYEMWREVLKRVMQLATDPEKICRSLFEPLQFQLLRWLTANSGSFPFEYAGMVDILVSNFSDPETAVRTLSARSIAVLLSLAIKNCKTDGIFKRIFSLCRHPGAMQRSSAALSISCFLRSLNEEDGKTFSQCALSCLMNLLYALRLCDRDAKNRIGGVVISHDVITKAVLKIERGICRFSHLFLNENISSKGTSLQQTTEWLFRHSTAPEVLFRQLCRRIFMSFSVLVDKSIPEWMQSYELKHSGESIIGVLVPISALANTDITIVWMDQLSASIESYVWYVDILGEKTQVFLEKFIKSRRENLKRKHAAEVNSTSFDTCEETLSWAISTFLSYDGPWEDSSKRSDEIAAYMSVVISICTYVKSSMENENMILCNSIDVDNRSFRRAVTERILQALLRSTSMSLHDTSLVGKIEDFCSYLTVHSSDWANQFQKTVDLILLNLKQCLAHVDSSETFDKQSETISSLSLFGSKVLCAGIAGFPEADKHAEMFALIASKVLDHGNGAPHDRLVIAAALKGAAACGWRITDIFLKPYDRQKYAFIYSDMTHVIASLAVWKRCASELASLSLDNDFVVNAFLDILRQVTSFKVYTPRSADWDMFTKTLLPNAKHFVDSLDAFKANTQRALSNLQVLYYILELWLHCSASFIQALCIDPILDIQNAVTRLLKERGCSYLVKANSLRLLRLLGPTSVLVSSEEQVLKMTLDALVEFVFDEFPIVSTDVIRDSKDFNTFHMLFLELLGVIERSKSVAYLKIIYPSLKEAEKHVFYTEIKQMLARFCITLGSGLQIESTVHADNMRLQLAELLEVLLDSTLDVSIRRVLLDEVFTPLLECQTGEVMLQFYLMESIPKRLSVISVLATLISASADVQSRGCQIGVYVAYSLVDILYRLVDGELIRTDINAAFLGHTNGKGREFTMLVCKCASKLVTKEYSNVDELNRMACCAAYRCLLSAVSRTQKQEKLYDQILFQPALWSNIVDPARQYELAAETEIFTTIPLSTLSTVSLQSKLDTSNMASTNQKRTESTALQFFTSSSLSMDAERVGPSTMTASIDIDQAVANFQNIIVKLDDLNQHPCMIPLLRVLVQMKTDFGSSWSTNSMPGWMKKIFNVIVEASTGLNVRLFLAKVVLNVPDVFFLYSESWLRAVIETLLDVNAAQMAPEFNYILRDCCSLVLDSWQNVAVTPFIDTASQFVNELIHLCPNRNKLVCDNNVLLVTKLIALWKNLIYIDARELIIHIISEDGDIKLNNAKQFAALQIVSAMLTAGHISKLRVQVSDHTIEDGILLVMTSKTTPLYTLAAEVGGLYLQTTRQIDTDAFMCKLKSLIIKAYDEEDFGRFLAILRYASLDQANIIDSVMLQRVSFVLPRAILVDAWALFAIDIINHACRNDAVVKDIFTHVQSVLGRFVAHRHSEVQLGTLRVIKCILNNLTVSEIDRLVANALEGGIDVFRHYEGHTSESRALLFTLAKELYHIGISDQSKSKIKVSLLHGLCDPDASRRKEAFDFWNTSAIAMNSCSDRLLAIFGSLYSPDFDDRWVLYATNILIGMSENSKEFKQPLFASSLGSGEYSDTQIDASWESKSQSMLPLFSVEADALSAHSESRQQLNSSTKYSAYSQPLESKMQSQLYSNALTSRGSRLSYSQSSGETNVAPGQVRFLKQRAAVDHTTDKVPSNKDKVSKLYFQDQHGFLKKREEAQIIRERNQRQGHVMMKRSYRVGEYPDIQITQQDIVDPVMALCEISVETSGLVFSALFSSITGNYQFEKIGIAKRLTEKLNETLILSKTSSIYVDCIVSAYLKAIIGNPRLCDLIPLRPETIGDAGLSSGKYHICELALEEILTYKIQSNTDLELNELVTNCWDLLHKLLGTVRKRNFLTALSIACSTIPESKQALEAQLSGDLPLAISLYKKAESILHSQMECLDDATVVSVKADAVRCRWQRYKCLETLNNWETLEAEISIATKKNSNFLWKQRPPYLEQGVGHYLHSSISLSKANQPDSILASLRNFIEGSSRDLRKAELVQSKFPVELCLVHLLSNDNTNARFCIETFYSTFLTMWRHTSPLASSSRLQLLQALSSMVQIDELFHRFGRDTFEMRKTKLQDFVGFVKLWERFSPSMSEDGIELWSQHTMVQNTIVDFLLKTASDQGMLSDEIQLSLRRGMSNTILQYASAAIICNIPALASKMLKSYRELCNTHQLPKLSVQMIEVFVAHMLKLVDRQGYQSSNPSSNTIITRYFNTATKTFDNAEIMQMMETAAVSDKVAMGYLEAKTFANAAIFYASQDIDDNLKEIYFSRAVDMFKASSRRVDAVMSNDLREGGSSRFLRCRLTFIEFLNDLLFKPQLEKLAKLADRKTLVKLLVDNVLGGIAAGDRECAHYFPQLCDVISPYQEIVTDFEQFVMKNVPLWTCLQWSAQLMALLNGPIRRTVLVILEKMAEKYPIALFYDFMVTCKSSLNKFDVDLHRLEVLLTNSVMEKFVAALRLLHHPELRLKEGLKEISELVEDNRTQDARHKVTRLWKDCFSLDRPLLGGQIGRYNREWSRKAKRDVEKIMGKDGSKMTAKSIKYAREWIMKHFGVTPDWGPPDSSKHVKILSFDSVLGVLASKQLPKKLTMHCSDEKEYTFLVKGGEDLRLDQRIEQVFGVMNQIFKADPRCRDQRLCLTTYEVFPMTQDIGLLEWVDGTLTLKGVIEAQMQVDERCIDLKSDKSKKLDLFNTIAAKAYESFHRKQQGASFSAKIVAPRSKDVVDQFHRVQAMIPADLLRRQLLALGLNFEAFLLVRDHFLKSLAVFSACSYILGIGDRHLDNFLIDLSSGRVIGIDFGVSFGAGASVLPIPELIPFRYTRQMEFVFQPYDGANLVCQDMQAVFDALRSKRQVIESVMNVFLHDPLLDWQQSTAMHQKVLFESVTEGDTSTFHDSDAEMEDVQESADFRSNKNGTASTARGIANAAWLPDIKIAIARRKLDGISPALLLKEELSQNSHLTHHLSKFYALVDAASFGDIDERDNEVTTLSSLGQAQQLLAIATAPDLLGRTFQGWMPWV
ncbi:hypothetical protein CCR75_003605 [Bremia lactucae]|uniref:Non-specific serine/threonine protein kinase n=1 Tax=Bremia lactucae TaxID=4779 RepID=A0A976FF64_BRELC|nr:hypothetical protein CCR75_003605 [Bremia lactucae]